MLNFRLVKFTYRCLSTRIDKRQLNGISVPVREEIFKAMQRLAQLYYYGTFVEKDELHAKELLKNVRKLRSKSKIKQAS